VNLISDPVNYFLLNGRRSPGIAEFPSGASAPRKWDPRKGYGLSGGGIVYTGDDLAKFTVRISLFSDDDWTAWDAFAPLVLKPPSGTKPKAMDIWHPITEAFLIRSVVVEDLTGPTQSDAGVWAWEVKFIQYRPPKPAIAKPTASTAKPEPPKSANDILIDRLSSQFQSLLNPPPRAP